VQTNFVFSSKISTGFCVCFKEYFKYVYIHNIYMYRDWLMLRILLALHKCLFFRIIQQTNAFNPRDNSSN